MRPSPFALLGGAAILARAQSLTSTEETDPKKVSTEFNGIKVPALLDLTPTNYESEINKTKYLMVKHYSPYCPHCLDYAPMYQTAYEFYYTSKPAIDGAKDASFMSFYDFRFGLINCVAYYDLCVNHGVQSYPTTIIYEDGELLQSMRGVKEIDVLSEAIESVLENSKPGTRPKTLALPDPGDKESPKGNKKIAVDDDEDADVGELPSELKKSDQSGDLPQIISSPDEKPLISDKLDKDKKTAPGAKGGRKPFGTDWKMPTAGEKAKEKKPQKPSTTPNPAGGSVSLTAESFQKLVTMTHDPWFVKFYAPWCPHCQAMGPVWDQLAKNMKGKLNIGEVNCDKERRLCKDVHANSFPTLLFFKGGERAEYQGLRGLGDFVQYSEKALDLAGGVPEIDALDLKELEEKEEVIFIYFYDHATTSEDFEALERLPLNLIGHAKLVKTCDPALYDRFKITTFPRMLVSREGRPTYYQPLTPDEMRDVNGLLDWMRSVWLALVPELTASNARQIMDGKIIVLGVLDREDQDSFQVARREIKSAANEWMDRQIHEFQSERKKLRDAKQMRIEEAEDRDDQRALRSAKSIRINMDNSGRKEVGFAWVDGVFWQRWIRTTYGIDVKDGERVIINDEDSRRYWDNTVTGNYILVSRTSIMETLDKIVYGPHVIKPKYTISALAKVFFDIKVTAAEHPYLTLGCVAGIIFGAVSWHRGRGRRARGHFRMDDSMGRGGLKDGLLGHNVYAKAD